MAIEKNDNCRVTITGYSSEGMGITRIDGIVVFVKNALAGEVCDVQILKTLKNCAYARIVEVVTPSAHRREPDCPNYGRCGGCDFRHMDYAEECSAKQERVQNALQRIGGCELEPEPFCGAGETTHYRNKCQFPISVSGNIGFYRARTHEVIPMTDCLIQSPVAAKIAAVVQEYIAKNGVSGYNEISGKGLLRHLFVRVNAKGECLCCLLANGTALPCEEELIAAIRAAVPETVGIVLGIHRKPGNGVLGERYRTLWGVNSLTDTLGALEFRLSVPSFYQVNREMAQTLYGKVLDFAQLTGKETVLDLYCGIGTITLTLAKAAKHVIGAEIVPEAIADARENAARNGVQNVEFFCGDAGAVAEKLAADALAPDLICVDPP
ncbi:MAG: 23S rRNA (uracil(1939)-C(5))-methyltransferase RlmD, partial [Ruthenibacterium sp.]